MTIPKTPDKAPQVVIRVLRELKQKAQSLTDEDDGRCGVPREHKDAVRTYVDASISWRIEELLRWAQGGQTAKELDRNTRP